MSVAEIKKSSRVKDYIGLSTDTKPTASDCDAGSTFYEADTKIGYIFDGFTTWYQL